MRTAAIWKEWFQRRDEGLSVDRALLEKIEACGATLAEVTSRRVSDGRDGGLPGAVMRLEKRIKEQPQTGGPHLAGRWQGAG